VSTAGDARRKRLSDFLGDDVAEASIAPDRDVWITGIATDSRRVRGGDLFVATRGALHDGHDFIDAAVANGAVAVLAEHDVPSPAPIVVVTTQDSRRAAGRVAARFYDHPSRTLGCIGVTGTNGKTSVAQFVAMLLTAAGQPSGYGGTLGWSFAGKHCPADLTTEDAVTVQRRLADLVAAGAEWVAMETSSHALDQDRVAEVAYDIAVFTNLTRDHLDYHGTMERYAAAKRRLFDWPTLQSGVVNWDDPQGRIIYRDRSPAINLLRFGSTADADLAWSDLAFDEAGIEGVLATPWGRRAFRLPLFGEFNVANFAAATAAACLAGASIDDVIGACQQLTAPPGRMQFVRAPGKPLVVIDFAHTPDALSKVLAGLRHHAPGRIVCVFGCGGDRDRGKRPLMARAAEAGADQVWVTSDNPRSEDPARIAADISSGFQSRVAVAVELDRAAAIRGAVAAAMPSDVVLVAGKGHEPYQEIAGTRYPFMDLDVVQRVLGIAEARR
jgi:UDP-N-acetylmuramoyl-L-alanyl-D-glutamate--2,6-diaminopimelate ligase